MAKKPYKIVKANAIEAQLEAACERLSRIMNTVGPQADFDVSKTREFLVLRFALSPEVTCNLLHLVADHWVQLNDPVQKTGGGG